MRPEVFRTANLAAAAYLTAGKHLTLLDIDVSDPRRAIFVFDDPDDRGSGLETGFVSGGALVPGAEFHRQLRVLRRLIDERVRNSRKRSMIDDTQDRQLGGEGFRNASYANS